MEKLTRTYSLVAPFGFFADEFVHTAARTLREEAANAGVRFQNFRLTASAEEGNAELFCAEGDDALHVEREIGMHSLHAALCLSVETENEEKLLAAWENALEKTSAATGATAFES